MREIDPSVREQLRCVGAALEGIAEGVVVADAAGGIVFAHAGGHTYDAAAAPGLSAEEQAARFAARALDGRPLSFHETPLGLALSGRSVVDQLVRARRLDGSDAVVRSSAAPVHDDAGRSVGAYALFHDVTAAHDAEAELRATSARLQAIFRALPDLYFRISADGTYLECIPGRAADLYAPAAQLLGRRMRDVLPAVVALRVEAAIAEAIRTGEVKEVEYALQLAQGEQHFEARVVALSSREAIVVVRNVSERIRSRELLRKYAGAESAARRAAEQREDQLRALLAALREGVTVVDGGGRVLLRNRADCEMLGGREDEGPDPSVLRVSRPDGLPVPHDRWPLERLRRGEEFQDEDVVVTGRDGTSRRVVASASVVRDEWGAPVAGIVVSRDVTDLLRLADAREDLIRTISHDLRTPLSVVLTAAQALIRDLRARSLEREGEHAARVWRSARRMVSLLADLVDSARLEEGRMELRRVPTDLAALVSSSVRSLAPEPPERVRVLSPERVPPVLADPDRLDRVVVNLVTNALKYSPAGAPVEVRISASETAAVVSVSDRGFGIAPEELPRVFERHYRARGAEGTEGAGLGLYIARQLVEAHGGRIWAESAPGAGSTFSFALPLADVSRREG